MNADIRYGKHNVSFYRTHPSRGLLILKEGFHDPADPAKSRTARVKPTRRFSDRA